MRFTSFALAAAVAWLAGACAFDSRGLWTDPVADPYVDFLAPGTDGGTGDAGSSTSSTDSAAVGDSVGIVPLEAGAIVQDDEVVICHLISTKPRQAHTIAVGPSAVATHLGHGDVLGPCE